MATKTTKLGTGPVLAVGLIIAGLLMILGPGITAFGLIFTGVTFLVWPHLPGSRILGVLGIFTVAIAVQGLAGIPLATSLDTATPDLAALQARLPGVELTPPTNPAGTVAGVEAGTPAATTVPTLPAPAPTETAPTETAPIDAGTEG